MTDQLSPVLATMVGVGVSAFFTFVATAMWRIAAKVNELTTEVRSIRAEVLLAVNETIAGKPTPPEVKMQLTDHQSRIARLEGVCGLSNKATT